MHLNFDQFYRTISRYFYFLYALRYIQHSSIDIDYIELKVSLFESRLQSNTDRVSELMSRQNLLKLAEVILWNCHLVEIEGLVEWFHLVLSVRRVEVLLVAEVHVVFTALEVRIWPRLRCLYSYLGCRGAVPVLIVAADC